MQAFYWPVSNRYDIADPGCSYYPSYESRYRRNLSFAIPLPFREQYLPQPAWLHSSFNVYICCHCSAVVQIMPCIYVAYRLRGLSTIRVTAPRQGSSYLDYLDTKTMTFPICLRPHKALTPPETPNTSMFGGLTCTENMYNTVAFVSSTLYICYGDHSSRFNFGLLRTFIKPGRTGPQVLI